MQWVQIHSEGANLYLHSTSVQLKPGFGIGNRNQGPILVSISEPKLFFPKPKLFFQKKVQKRFKLLSCFPPSWGDFYKLEKKSRNI